MRDVDERKREIDTDQFIWDLIRDNRWSTTRTETFHSWMIAEWVHIHIHPDAIISQPKIRRMLAVKQ